MTAKRKVHVRKLAIDIEWVIGRVIVPSRVQQHVRQLAAIPGQRDQPEVVDAREPTGVGEPGALGS